VNGKDQGPCEGRRNGRTQTRLYRDENINCAVSGGKVAEAGKVGGGGKLRTRGGTVGGEVGEGEGGIERRI